MTPEEEAVTRAIMERDEKARVQKALSDHQGRREQVQQLRMQLLDKVMPMPPDAPHVPPQLPQGMSPVPAPRVQDITKGPYPDNTPFAYSDTPGQGITNWREQKQEVLDPWKAMSFRDPQSLGYRAQRDFQDNTKPYTTPELNELLQNMMEENSAQRFNKKRNM